MSHDLEREVTHHADTSTYFLALQILAFPHTFFFKGHLFFFLISIQFLSLAFFTTHILRFSSNILSSVYSFFHKEITAPPAGLCPTEWSHHRYIIRGARLLPSWVTRLFFFLC